MKTKVLYFQIVVIVLFAFNNLSGYGQEQNKYNKSL